MPAAHPYWKPLNQCVGPQDVSRFIPAACLLGHGSPTPWYLATLIHKSAKMPQEKVSSIRRQPFRDLPRRESLDDR